MSAYTITWETYRAMQDRITSLEKKNEELLNKVDHITIGEVMLLEAEREIENLQKEIERLKHASC
jgi:hypothetical protein